MSFDQILADVLICPICKSEQRIQEDGMSPKKTLGYHYLNPLAKTVGLSVSELVKKIRVYRCLTCNTFYCSPWFSAEATSRLFNVLSPTHIAGWRFFEYWLRDKATPNGARDRRILEMLVTKFGVPETYAEFGCPFQGLLPLLEPLERTSPTRRISKFAEVIRPLRDVRLTRLTSLYNALHALILKIIYFITYIENRSKISSVEDYLDLNINNKKIAKILLTQETTLSWGGNCVRFGKSCRALAGSMYGMDIMPLSEFNCAENELIDIIGVFNTLDHTRNPIDVLDKLTSIGRAVVIVNHDSYDAGRQHGFAFSENLIHYLRERYRALKVIDLAGELGLKSSKELIILIHH